MNVKHLLVQRGIALHQYRLTVRYSRSRMRLPLAFDVLTPLQGEDIQIGNFLEVAEIECDYVETEIERCGPDDEVREVDADTLVRLLAVNAPGQQCHFQRERMHGAGSERVLRRRLPGACGRPLS